MATPNGNFPLPSGLSEADLLALVEGEPLDRDRREVIRVILGRNPALARTIEAMRRDRAVLRSMDDVAAPAGLIGAVEAALQPVLEREMLLGLREGEPVEDHPPVSRVIPRNTSGRRLAMAAGLLLVVGSGALVVTTMMRGPGGATTPVVVAPKIEGSARIADAGVKAALPAPTKELAVAEHRLPPTELADAAAMGPPYDSTLADSTVDAPEWGPPAPGPIEPIDAAVLAAEHRLVIRVVAPDSRVLAIADQLKHPRLSAWQLAGETPAALAIALDPGVEHRAAPTREVPAIAANESTAPPGGTIGAPAPETSVAQLPSVFLLNTRLDEASLKALRSALRDAGASEVVFDEQESVLPVGESLISAPSAVLWWSAGPAGWSGWGQVPVVIRR